MYYKCLVVVYDNVRNQLSKILYVANYEMVDAQCF